MHILFVHNNLPAQFGHIAEYLIRTFGYRCTYVCRNKQSAIPGVEVVRFAPVGGATKHNHYCTRSFENATRNALGVYRTLAERPDIKPDLIVGHSGFGSTLFLRELYSCPIINYFEYYYHASGTDLDFRTEFPSTQAVRLRAKARNATILLDLDNCTAGYSPTVWQHSLLPDEYKSKVSVLFDGIDTRIWKRTECTERQIAGNVIDDSVRIVTYVARGLESMRGFDVFMDFADKLSRERRDVVFIVVGQSRSFYGDDTRYTGGVSYKQWVLSRSKCDLSRFIFVDWLPPVDLARGRLGRTDLEPLLFGRLAVSG